MKFLLNTAIGVFLALSISTGHADTNESPEEVLKEIKTLYQELIIFKDTSTFAEFGFSKGGPHSQWLDTMKELVKSKKGGIEFIRAYGFVPGDLLQLGQSYLSNKGIDDDYTTYTSEMLKEAFSKE